MVYIDPNVTNDITFSAQDLSINNKAVVIKYNGSGIHDITGPVPFITFNRTLNKNESGYANSTKVGINLSGKIVRTPTNNVNPPGTGIAPIMGAIDNLKKLFVDNGYNGVLSIECGSTSPVTVFSATGVRLNSFTADKSNDNWVFTADYAIDLEYYEYGPEGSGFLISSSSDSWSIEPIEDSVYTNFVINETIKKEKQNPKIKDPTIGASINLSNPTTETINLRMKNIPQYKVSRKVSAVGLPRSSGLGGSYSSYLEAQKWVSHRLSTAFNGANSGLPFFTNSNPNSLSSFTSIYLYNHFRSTNFSVSDGSYEVNDSWIAMPTGMPYIEDFNIETSTDDRFIKTVKIAGEIKGLNISSFAIMSGAMTGLIPSSTGPTGQIVISGYDQLQSGSLSHNILDINDSNTNSDISQIYPNKYSNANSGWIFDIKPYLYRRASSVLNSMERTDLMVDPANSALNTTKNPIYCKENLLNIIPVSTTEGHNPRKGTISYNYEYNNKLHFISGAFFENITISDTGPADVISEAFVLGRRLGPVLQNLGARTTSKKEVNIEIGVPTPSSIGGFLLTNSECPLYTGGPVYGQIETLLSGIQPFGDRATATWGSFDHRSGGSINNSGQVYKASDTQSWNPMEGRFTRNVSWTYQQCTNARNWLDH
jgi:hypothetical protein